MSDIEQRLARDIEAVTKGVVVTESELLVARGDLDERIEGSRRRTRRAVAAVAAAGVVIAGGLVTYQALGAATDTTRPAGPTPTFSDPYLAGDPPTPQLLAGFWREDNGATSMLFREDGTWQADVAGTVYSNPAAWGSYQINGDTITVAVTGGETCGGAQFSMRASVIHGGNLGTTAPQYRSDAGCTLLPLGRRIWEHVLPATRHWAAMKFSAETGWRPLTDQIVMAGDWAAEGGGHVLEMTPDGAYYVLDQSAQAVDEGRWTLTGSELVLTSSARSNECKQGDRLVLANLKAVDSGTSAIRGTVDVNACHAPWTPKTWFLIPNGGQ